MKRSLKTQLNTKSRSVNRISSVPISVSELRDGETTTRYKYVKLIKYTTYAGSLYRLTYIDAKFDQDINDNIVKLSDGTGGTASNSLAAISGSGDDSDINNNFADLASKLNEILSKLTEILSKYKWGYNGKR